MKKLWCAAIFVIAMAIFPMIMYHINIGHESYVERNTGFHFSQSPECTYALDQVGHGKEFDMLEIFTISSDAAEFERYVHDNGWNLLPLTEEIVNHPICEADFDGNMSRMLNCNHGYWNWNADSCRLIVYDTDNQMIYIRKSTLFYGLAYARP